MRQALECCHRGWGECIIIGVAGAGQEIATRPFQLVTGGCGRARPSAARGAAPTCRASSTGTWTARSRSTPLITHKLPLERINEAFDLMHAGESIRTVVEF
jgi:S-(hydroxymethyl)glutathione dehydrogenase/alcohol dehydrogenase